MMQRLRSGTLDIDRVDDLGIFGGVPAFDGPLHVGRPNLGDRRRLLARINTILDSRWFTNAGPYTQEFEQRIADYVGVEHCVAMCSGTVALEIAIRALELKGEVIVPSFTFVATAHALQWQEITPVFCDIEPMTHTIDPGRVEELITPRTTGVLGVHLWGHPAAIDDLAKLAKRHDLKLLFDASHAFGCSFGGRRIGGFGNVEVFSFHATKLVNSFEGGAVVTNDSVLGNKMRMMRNFGFTGLDRVSYIGTNGKMHEVSAAMGLTSLERLTEFVAINRRNYAVYKDELSMIAGLRLVRFDESEPCNYHYIVVEVNPTEAGISRDDLAAVLHGENVLARRYFYPGCHNMEPYRSYFPQAGLVLPTTEDLIHRVLLLPTGESVGVDDVRRICRIVRFAVAHGAEISARRPRTSQLIGAPVAGVPVPLL